MITSVDIHESRTNYIAHLEDEELLFFIVPLENDGSDNWNRLQEWLDAGNEITDTIEWRSLYKGTRQIEYPDIGEQLDMLWHAIDTNTLDKTSDFYNTLKSVKDNNPKPVEE